jgi:hypothetical protein
MSTQVNNQHTVFISYSSADEPWVLQHLLPRLKENKVNWRDGYEFRAGVTLVDEIERAIKECNRTILVLSPKYLEDTWQHFSGGLVFTFGANTNRWLAIPVIAAACSELPPHIKMLVNIDLTSDNDRAWEQLFEALHTSAPEMIGEDFADLKQPSAEAGGGKALPIGQGLKALCELMGRAEVKAKVERFNPQLKTAHSQIQRVADYKDMHDELHLMQKECLQPLWNAIGRFPDDEQARENVLRAQVDLERNLESIQQMLQRPTFNQTSQTWVVKLAQSLYFLTLAIETNDAAEPVAERERRIKALQDAVEHLDAVLASQPTRLNRGLNEAADALRLSELLLALVSIRTRMVAPNQEEEEIEKVRMFEAAIDNLTDLYRKLKVLVNDHHKWQDVDTELRRIKNNFKLLELELSWGFLLEMTEPLYLGRSESWAEKFREISNNLGAAIEAGDFEKAKEPFQRYYSRASDRFIRVDKAIQRLCNDLREVGQSLSLVLEIIQ